MGKAKERATARLRASMLQESELWERLCYSVRDNASSIGDRLRALESACQRELQSMDLPAGGVWAANYQDGLWCEIEPGDAIPPGWQMVSYYPPIDEIASGDIRRSSIFLYYLLDDISKVRSALAAGDAQAAAARAFQLGLHMKTMGYPAREVDRQRGMRNRADLNEAAVRNNKKILAEHKAEWDEWQAEANGIWSRHPHWSKSSVATEVVKIIDPGLNVDTVRKRIKKVGMAQ